MAKTYEEFLKTFNGIELKVRGVEDAVQRTNSIRNKQVDLALQAAKAIGVRVRALREDGMVGVSLGTFEGDGEIKKCVALIKSSQATYDSAQKAMVEAKTTTRKAAMTELASLKAALTTEIAARKKEIIKSKSLPDMEKLLASVGALEKRATDAGGRVPEPENFMTFIQPEIDKSKGVAAEEEEDELQEQRLNERIVATQRSTLMAQYKILDASVSKALEAMKANKASDMQAHEAAATKAHADVKRIADEYTGLQTKWKNIYMGTKPGPKIDTMINEMKAVYPKANALLIKIPKDWKPAVPVKK
ncbi:MAG: hypothetical protein HBSAPP03_16400 [Phycisphaerae bacterium]|nr:MAG: hypothetical protein HBSAPP03_16400 [Phycisphaerae bacterium]